VANLIVPTGRRSYHQWMWSCLALALLVGGAPGEIRAARSAAAEIPAALGRITPIPQPPEVDPLKLSLGQRLFRDTRLSRDGMRTCASCHDVVTNGANGNRRGKAPHGSEIPFNVITVFNAALSFRFNWEGNFSTLEEQAEASLENPAIMEGSVDETLEKLNADRDMVDQFRGTYGRGPDRASLLDAIASYERSLVTPDSRFDRWLGGDATALSAEEQTGYRLFQSLGCVSCHQGVNIGGNLFERSGIFHPLASSKPAILRVPSLRNVAVTPPYFHDGSAPTLRDAVQKMGNAQLNWTLSEPEIDAIVAFLTTLTGTYQGRPLAEAAR
jgi:cytochrome c peroxidase